MKKSDVIKEIQNVIYDYTCPAVGDLTDPELAAIKILDRLISMGMLPAPDYRAIIIRKPKWEDE